MEVLTSLLRSKNRCLDKFLACSHEFWAQAEMGDLSALDAFESRRSSILQAIQLYDRKINESVALLPKEGRTPELIEAVRSEITRGEGVVGDILRLDARITARLEHEKTLILAQANATHKSREILGKFKSEGIRSGGELDEKL